MKSPQQSNNTTIMPISTNDWANKDREIVIIIGNEMINNVTKKALKMLFKLVVVEEILVTRLFMT